MKTAKALGITNDERKYLIKAERILSTMRRGRRWLSRAMASSPSIWQSSTGL